MDSTRRKRRRSGSISGELGVSHNDGGGGGQSFHQNSMHLGAAADTQATMPSNGGHVDGWHNGSNHMAFTDVDSAFQHNAPNPLPSPLNGYMPHQYAQPQLNEPASAPPRSQQVSWHPSDYPQTGHDMQQYRSFQSHGMTTHHLPDPYAPQPLAHAPVSYPGMASNIPPPPYHASHHEPPALSGWHAPSSMSVWQTQPLAGQQQVERGIQVTVPHGAPCVPDQAHPVGGLYTMDGKVQSQGHSTPARQSPLSDSQIARPTKARKSSSKSGSGTDEKKLVVASTTPGAKGFVACIACRQRKIKCNGLRPQCTNCSTKNLKCEYDEVVKRRGPDKQPGGRMRKREAKHGGGKCDVPKGTGANSGATSSAGSPRMSATAEESKAGGGMAPTADFTFGSSTTASATLATQTYRMSPSTQHRFENMALDEVGLGVHYNAAPVFTGLNAPGIKPQIVPRGLAHERWDSDLVTTDNSVVVQGSNESQVAFSWMAPPQAQLNQDLAMSQLTYRPKLVGSTSPRLAVSDLLDSPVRIAGTGIRATISPNTDSNEESDVPITPPDLSLDFERIPNIAYARDQDWAWMAGLFSDRRDHGMAILDRRLREVFDMGLSWFGSINRSAFFSALHHPLARLDIQPALVLSLLACNTLFRTGADGPGHPGRQLACGYADAARAMIQQSIVANKADPGLAQAALVLAIFESCPHPHHSMDRMAAALKQMDAIMQTFCLFAIDVTDERASIFLPNQVPKLVGLEPAAGVEPVVEVVSPEIEHAVMAPESRATSLTTWSPVPKWPVYWSEGEMRKDESRRVAWTASIVAASFSTWSLAMGRPPLDLYCAQPENYALFFPAEVLLLNDAHSTVPIGKRTMWALFHRVVLLWHFTVRLYHEPLAYEHKAQVAQDIFAELDTIEKALFDMSTETGNLYRWQARDWILNIRRLMTEGIQGQNSRALISKDALKYDPAKAREWLATQARIATGMAESFSKNGDGNALIPFLYQRPMYVWWLLGQAKTACDFYERDSSLTSAVDLVDGLWKAIDKFVECWPCSTVNSVAAAFKQRYDALKRRSEIQAVTGVHPV